MILNSKYISILADNAKKNKKYMKHLKSFKVFESYEDSFLSDLVRELLTQGLNVQTEELEEYENREDIKGLPEHLPIRVWNNSETGSLDLRYSFERFNLQAGGLKGLGDLTWSDEDQNWYFRPTATGRKTDVSVLRSKGDIDYKRLADILKTISHPTNYRSR